MACCCSNRSETTPNRPRTDSRNSGPDDGTTSHFNRFGMSISGHSASNESSMGAGRPLPFPGVLLLVKMQCGHAQYRCGDRNIGIFAVIQIFMNKRIAHSRIPLPFLVVCHYCKKAVWSCAIRTFVDRNNSHFCSHPNLY
jgi:hypothetical protein